MISKLKTYKFNRIWDVVSGKCFTTAPSKTASDAQERVVQLAKNGIHDKVCTEANSVRPVNFLKIPYFQSVIFS